MDKNKTILIFSTAYMPFMGGAELAIKDITGRISDFSFVLITARLRRDLPVYERIGNVDVYRIGVGIPVFDKIVLPFAGVIAARRIVQKKNIRLFWGVMASYASMIPAMMSLFGFSNPIPFLLTLQEGDAEGHIARGRFGLVGVGWRLMLRQADRVQVISRYLENMARAYSYTGDITLIPNGVDTHALRASAPALLPADKTSKKIIFTASRLVEKNGINTLIRAFAKVHTTMPATELHIAGDGPLRSELEVLARLLGVGKQVVFLGEIQHEHIFKRYAAADIFVRPSRSEGLGTAFLEAMACGVPVIGTPVGGIIDFLKDGETGLFSREGDAGDLAEKIITLLEDADVYRKLQKNGKRLVEEKYDWNDIAARMRQLFLDMEAVTVTYAAL